MHTISLTSSLFNFFWQHTVYIHRDIENLLRKLPSQFCCILARSAESCISLSARALFVNTFDECKSDDV
jgi:hypothetical protein